MTAPDTSPEVLTRYLTNIRHGLHRHPELANEEFKTTAALREALEAANIRILPLPLKTGLVAEVGPEGEGPVVALRSDIDALPIHEQSEVPFASQVPGRMHACGHDVHATVALGAAMLLKQIEPQLGGRVRILFQPAEEIGQGANDIIATGVLSDVAAIFGIHNDPTLPVGEVGSKAGALTAGVDRFEIVIKAKGSHAASPHEGNDPIVILGQLITLVQGIVSRNVASDDNAVVSITHVQGGNTWNVIPESVYVEGTVRTFDSATRALIERRFREITDGLSVAFQATVELLWHPGPPSVMNDPHWVDVALSVASDVPLVAHRVKASAIGEDFAYYQHVCPGAFIMVGSGGPHALHHPAFRADDRMLYPAARYLSLLAQTALSQCAAPRALSAVTGDVAAI